MFQRNETQTTYAQDIESLVQAAQLDLRSPGRYAELCRTIYSTLKAQMSAQDVRTLHRDAGTSERVPVGERANAVCKHLEEEGRIQVLFEREGPSPDEREFVSGDPESDMRAVLVKDMTGNLIRLNGSWNVERFSSREVDTMSSFLQEPVDGSGDQEEEEAE